MDNAILNSYSKISHLNVSRETCNELENLISMIQRKNKEINIISKKMFEKEAIRERHIVDSAQIIDFIDLNCNTTSDLGTGGGMPGLIVAIVMKKIKNSMKTVGPNGTTCRKWLNKHFCTGKTTYMQRM